MKSALPLLPGKRALHLASHELRQQQLMVCRVRTASQQLPRQQNRIDKGFQHQCFAEGFHQGCRFDNTATETTLLFAEGNCQPTQLGKGLPVGPAKCVGRLQKLLPLCGVVLAGNKFLYAAFQHLLFCSQ